MLVCFAICLVDAQTYNMSNGTVNTCSGTFYDPGGTGKLCEIILMLLKPFVRRRKLHLLLILHLSELRRNDILTIYDGPNISSPVIGTFSGTTSPGIYSSSGCLTFRLLRMEVIHGPVG